MDFEIPEFAIIAGEKYEFRIACSSGTIKTFTGNFYENGIGSFSYAPGGGRGTVYDLVFRTWISSPSIGLATSGTGNIPSFTAVNNGTVPVTATITVGLSADACNSTEQKTFTITVQPTTNVNQPANQSLCNGAATAPVIFGGGVANTIFNWTNNTPSIGL